MSQDLKELTKLLRLLKKEGVLHFKSGDLELKLDPSSHDAIPTSSPDKKPFISGDPYTDADALFWSTPGVLDEEEDRLSNEPGAH